MNILSLRTMAILSLLLIIAGGRSVSAQGPPMPRPNYPPPLISLPEARAIIEGAIAYARDANLRMAVADREVRCNLEPTLLDVDKELTPALRTLAHPDLEADEFLLALWCSANQHQHAFGSLFHPSLQIDPIGPHVHVSPHGEVALLPSVIIRLPLRRQSRDHRGREVRRVLPQQGGEHLLKVAGRHPTKVENRRYAGLTGSPCWAGVGGIKSSWRPD